MEADGILKTNVDGVSYVASERDTLGAPRIKQGHKCCGNCCDVRRATIVVDIISASFDSLAIFGLIVLALSYSHDDFTDGEAEDWNDYFSDSGIGKDYGKLIVPTLVWSVFGLAVHICGIVGAIRYNIWLVGIPLLKYMLDIVTSLIHANVLGIIMPACFAYPHIFFIMEVRKGIMLRENYHNEEHSCCCV